MRNVLSFHRERPYEWKPWENTLAYYPLDWDILDYSGNWYNWTWANWTEKYTTLSSWIQVAEFSWWVSRVTTTFSWTPKTVSVWACKSTKLSDPSPNDWKQIIWQNSADSGAWWIFRNVTTNSVSHIYYVDGNTYVDLSNTEYKDKWIHYLVTVDWNTTKFYLNWEYKWSVDKAINVNRSLWMWTAPYDSNSRYTLYWYISEVILEDKGWTTQEVAKYYNRSKSNYQSSSGWWGTQGAAIQ